jgi:hypothetical protein
MEGKMNNAQCGEVRTAPVSVADEILSQASMIGEMAATLTKISGSKLGRICRDQPPGVPCEEKKNGREYPQYFAELADKLKRIEYELRALEDIISRCEV